MKVAVAGSGSWGTALAITSARAGNEVALWSRRPDAAARLETERENREYLHGFRFPDSIRATAALDEAIEGAEIVVAAVPSYSARGLYRAIEPMLSPEAVVVSAAKGIEIQTLERMSLVARDELGEEIVSRYVALSGPSFAVETARGEPTAVVAASRSARAAETVQRALSSHAFRVYTNDDVTGTELGGAVKNVIAIATGGVAGLGLGSNPAAAIITRGLAEMTRLAVRMGGRVETLAGLAGLGDLVLTCTGALSRNRHVGFELGRGLALEEVLAGMHEVAEGVKTTRAVRELGRQLDVELPITEAVYALLYDGKTAPEMVDALMGRPLKKE
jgi:glycerol-3-phosphate dehydrogenase (NAD(P)+)